MLACARADGFRDRVLLRLTAPEVSLVPRPREALSNGLMSYDFVPAPRASWSLRTGKWPRFSTTQDTRPIASRQAGARLLYRQKFRGAERAFEKRGSPLHYSLLKFSTARHLGSMAWLERSASFMVWRESSRTRWSVYATGSQTPKQNGTIRC